MPIRELVKGAYPGKTWATKVDKMSDSQVFAVYARLKSQGKILGEPMKLGLVFAAGVVVGVKLQSKKKKLVDKFYDKSVDYVGGKLSEFLMNAVYEGNPPKRDRVFDYARQR